MPPRTAPKCYKVRPLRKKDYKAWKGMSGGERHRGGENDVRKYGASDVNLERG